MKTFMNGFKSIRKTTNQTKKRKLQKNKGIKSKEKNE